MRRLTLTSLILALGCVTNAVAADPISYSTSAQQQIPVAPATGQYDWSGFYAGVFGGYQRTDNAADRFGLGIDAGVNVTFNFMLAGAEVAVTGLTSDGATSAQIQGVGRAGVLVTDSLLAYGAAGYGIDSGDASNADVLVGGGLEYAVSPDLSVRAQYLRGMPVTGSEAGNQLTLGAQFHF